MENMKKLNITINYYLTGRLNIFPYALVRNRRIKIIIDSFYDFIIILSPTVGYFVEQEIKR